MTERAILFGALRGLVGVLTTPADPRPGPARAVVMSNIGMHHRVGPFRIYVELARRLAACGFHVLRFDLGGYGDSETAPGALADQEAMARDVVQAMGWLSENVRAETFILVGLCSGVDSTHDVAAVDGRVSGAVFIDGYTYPTLGFHLRRYAFGYRAVAWKIRDARRRLRGGTRGGQEPPAPPATGLAVFDRVYPPRAKFRGDVARMHSRGAKLLFIYTGGANGSYNSNDQLFEMLGPGAWRDHIEVERRAGADHILTSIVERAAVIDRICEWAARIHA